MSTYQLLPETLRPRALVNEIPNGVVGLYRSLDSRHYVEKGSHVFGIQGDRFDRR